MSPISRICILTAFCCFVAIASALSKGGNTPEECGRYNFILLTEQVKSRTSGLYDPLQNLPLQKQFDKCKPYLMAELVETVQKVPEQQRLVMEKAIKESLENEGEDMASFRALASIVRGSATESISYYMENPGPFDDLCQAVVDKILRPFVTFYQLEIYDLVFGLPKWGEMSNDVLKKLHDRTDTTTTLWLTFARMIRRYDITTNSIARKVAREMERGNI